MANIEDFRILCRNGTEKATPEMRKPCYIGKKPPMIISCDARPGTGNGCLNLTGAVVTAESCFLNLHTQITVMKKATCVAL